MPTPIIFLSLVLVLPCSHSPGAIVRAFGRRSLNQAQRKVEFRAQLFFAPRHPSIVALVIVAAQMQDAVQHQNFNFLGRRVSERARILRCHLHRNGDFARKMFSRVELGRKGEHVGGLVGCAETTVQRLHLSARSQQDIDRALQSGGAAGAGQESLQCQVGQVRNALLKDDHV